MTDILTQGEVEEQIMALVDLMGEVTEAHADAAHEAADAEADYRLAYWRTFLRHKDGVGPDGKRGESDKACEGRATIAAENELRSYKVTAAKADALKQALRTHQSRLDALRTIAANIRSQT